MDRFDIRVHDRDAQPRWNGTPRSSWCECDTASPGEWIFRDDGACACGINKHHYHCPHCGGVKQVG